MTASRHPGHRPAAAQPALDDIPFSYTLGTIDTLVRKGIHRNAWLWDYDADERYAVGWHAAVEFLYTAETAPEPNELTRAAWRAADALTNRTLEERGVPRTRENSFATRRDMPRFHAYWMGARHVPSHEDSIVESLAREQIWPCLNTREQEAVKALAEHRTYQQAAAALGVNLPAFYRQIADARRQFLRRWMEGETPRRGWYDRRVQSAARPSENPDGQRHTASEHIRLRKRAAAAK